MTELVGNSKLKEIVIVKYAVLVLILLAVGCNQPNDRVLSGVTVFRTKDCPVKNPFLKDSLPDRWRFVKLETSDDCLIGQIQKVAVHKNFIVVQDDKRTLVFDSTGAFRNRIGQIGRGPQEQLSMGAFYVYGQGEFIGVYDILRKKIFRYGFDGKLLEKVGYAEEMDFIKDMSLADDQNLVVLFTNAQDYPNEYGVFKAGNYAFRDYALPYRVTGATSCGVAQPSMAKNNGMFLMTSVLNDTLYTWHDGRVDPLYVIQTGKQAFPQKAIDDGGPYDYYPEVVSKAQKKGYSSGIERVWLTEKFGCAEYHIYRGTGTYYLNNELKEITFHAVNYLIWDLKTRRAIHYSPAGTWGSSLFYPGRKTFCTATENALVSCIPAYEIAGIDRAKMDDDPIYSDPRIREIVDSTEENDNPVIVYYPLDSI